MIYRGFNQVELKKITEILDRHGVQYQVGVPDEAMEFINDKTKRVNHRFMESVVQIEIESSEFDKIPENDQSKLLDLRIYREMESPFTEEELAGIVPDAPVKPKVNPEHTAMNKWATILAVTIVGLFFLLKHGFFK